MTRTEIQNALSVLKAAATEPRSNFLHDMNLARWIVGRLGLESGDHV
jgi:hypothetical protein